MEEGGYEDGLKWESEYLLSSYPKYSLRWSDLNFELQS